MTKIAVISVLMDAPHEKQESFNSIISKYAGIVRGRVGIPFAEQNVAALAIIAEGGENDIKALVSDLNQICAATEKEN